MTIRDEIKEVWNDGREHCVIYFDSQNSIYNLYEIPQYGGEEQYVESGELQELIDYSKTLA